MGHRTPSPRSYGHLVDCVLHSTRSCNVSRSDRRARGSMQLRNSEKNQFNSQTNLGTAGACWFLATSVTVSSIGMVSRAECCGKERRGPWSIPPSTGCMLHEIITGCKAERSNPGRCDLTERESKQTAKSPVRAPPSGAAPSSPRQAGAARRISCCSERLEWRCLVFVCGGCADRDSQLSSSNQMGRSGHGAAAALTPDRQHRHAPVLRDVVVDACISVGRGRKRRRRRREIGHRVMREGRMRWERERVTGA